jgi:hypothetical protein
VQSNQKIREQPYASLLKIQTTKYLIMRNCRHYQIVFWFLALFGFLAPASNAQQVVDSSLLDRISTLEKEVADKKQGDDHFMVAGLATFGFVTNKTTIAGVGSKSNSFPDADHFEFSPLLLWRHGNKFLLEFEPSFDGSTLGVNWADVSWFAAPGFIVRAGYLVLPFGTYSKRLAAGWIDKLPTDPTGVADVPPTTDFGVEIEGGLPLGNMKWSYDVALSNGLQLLPDGQMQSAGFSDNNKNKTVTARLALLPLSNSSLEIGVSGMFGHVGDEGSSFESSKTDMYALDLNYVKLFSPILVNVKGQYNYIHVNDQQYLNPADSSNYSFENTTKTGFAQISLRPTGVTSKWVKNLEVAFRYGNYTTPKASLWGEKTDVTEFGLLYWFSWRTVFKLGYTTSKSNSSTIGLEGVKTVSNSFFAQFAIQL